MKATTYYNWKIKESDAESVLAGAGYVWMPGQATKTLLGDTAEHRAYSCGVEIHGTHWDTWDYISQISFYCAF